MQGSGRTVTCNKTIITRRASDAWEILRHCTLCPHECGVNRLKGEKGRCRTTNQALISSFGPHFGEESPLTGTDGSGTVFFTWCNMQCIYCQNYEISQMGEGYPVTPETLAFAFLSLQEQGCHNLNLVTPSHVVPFILKGLALAVEEGFSLPVVYNTGGYDSVTTLELLDGIVDIYMPDFKYWDEATARRLSKVKNYPEITRKALKEMHRQTGDLETGHNGIARRGVLVRHLVLPGGLAGTDRVMEFIGHEISSDTYVNIMDQYRPCGAGPLPSPLDRRITAEEYQAAIDAAKAAGLKRIHSLMPWP